MPFYEYQCKSCGHELEAMQKVSDSPIKKCPHCGKSQLQRLMSAPVFRLKGGGWYETDFKGDKENQRNLADKPEADASKESKDKDSKGEAVKEDSKSTDAKTADTGAGKDSTPAKEKAADKPAEKSAGTSDTKKPAVSASRGRKSVAKRPARKSVAKAKRRR
jgi:putative FmdB family regulatory protein